MTITMICFSVRMHVQHYVNQCHSMALQYQLVNMLRNNENEVKMIRFFSLTCQMFTWFGIL